MSSSRIDQRPVKGETSGELSSRRASLVVNLSSRRQHRSSVTTTTTKRRPLGVFAQSLGGSFASSPLDDLRASMANADLHDDVSRMIFTRREGPSPSRARARQGADTSTPGSAPATLFSRRLVVDDDDSGPLETTATIKLARAADESPTGKPANNADSRRHNLLQVVELQEECLGELAETDSQTGPIVEVKQTSSSASSSSSANSSPVSSRQSSDCERRSSLRRASSGKQQQEASSQSAPSASLTLNSSSSSSSESSSRKLIRRRTVRRSYHHRALEESAERHQPLLVTTTTLTQRTEDEISPTRRDPRKASESETEHRSPSRGHLLSPASATSNSAATKIQSSASRLSTSRSSSKIATITTSSSSSSSSTTNHHRLNKSSTTSKQTINKSLSQRQDEMTAASKGRPIGNTDLAQSANSLLTDSNGQQSLFERRNRSPVLAAAAELAASRTASVALEKEEANTSSSSSVRKSSELSTSSSSRFNASSSLTKSTQMHHRQLATGLLDSSDCPLPASAAISSATSSSCETSLSRSATKKTISSAGQQICHEQQQHQQQADLSSSSHFRSVFLSSSSAAAGAAAAAAAASANRQKRSFLASPDNLLLSSPDVRSLVQELGSDLAELESAMTASNSLTVREQFASRSTNELTSRLFGTLPPAPSVSCGRYKIEGPPSPTGNGPDSLELLMRETNSTIRALEDDPPGELSPAGRALSPADSSLDRQQTASGAKIRELMNKAQRHRLDSGTGGEAHELGSCASLSSQERQQADFGPQSARSPLNENEAVKGKIERIDQRMNDLCRKLEACNDTQKAIELLKIMIQTIEKAWSIPVCGDDLGFKLCNSLRQFGGLDMILGFIHEADARLLLQKDQAERLDKGGQVSGGPQSNAKARPQLRPAKQLKLNLSKLQQQSQEESRDLANAARQNDQDDRRQQPDELTARQAKEDEDSDMLTSDLGLDSTTSVESLSYVSARGPHSGSPSSQLEMKSASAAMQTPPASDDSIVGSSHDDKTMRASLDEESQLKAAEANDNEAAGESNEGAEAELRRAREEELVLLSAHLLSQCLTSENRDYIVKSGLDPVIKLACQFTTMKSKQSKKLLKRSKNLLGQSATLKRRLANRSGGSVAPEAPAGDEARASELGKPSENDATEPQSNEDEDNVGENNIAITNDDMHSPIGTEILQHLFKHSEETCSRMITLGALQAILYGCRSSQVETLRHCASALANLALYGGPDSQQTMVEQKAHVWLFPLAFNEDDNVQYYACLAIVVLAANQEIEADVLKSSTLDLVEPFVTSHEPRKFAESTTSHIHGQSAAWLRKLMPLLDSKREEARNLACFHFAMEAHIKREQGQTQLFKEIGSIEPLRRAGSSPIAIASKFACQALRLIGEREPHKLSQQVPLWTCDDVCEWVSQIGFERFRPAFRESHVDGDLLLQLDEEMLKFDIGIENGIIRRRFLRELGHLKRLADYSSVDKSSLGQLLITSTSLMSPKCSLIPSGAHNQLGADGSGAHSACCASTSGSSGLAKSAREYLQYIYPIIQLGVTRDNIHLVDCDQLLAECKITNALHRIKLANSIRELQDRVMLEAASSERDSFGGAEQKTLDVFVSYRRSTGSQLASLLKVHLQLRGFSVFIDVERLEAGKFDNNLLESIRMAKNFILVLSPNALDRCIGDHECKDWVHKEIVAALASNCNIIPIIDNFHWPDPEQLPEDMRSISYFNGIRWIHDYQDACVDKVERFIRGELNNSSASQITTAGCPSTISMGSGGGQQRLGFASSQTANVSTPSIIASSLSLCGPQSGAHHAYAHPHNGSQTSTLVTSASANKSNHDLQPASNVPTDPIQHPLANFANPYLICGNANPNIRLR